MLLWDLVEGSFYLGKKRPRKEQTIVQPKIMGEVKSKPNPSSSAAGARPKGSSIVEVDSAKYNARRMLDFFTRPTVGWPKPPDPLPSISLITNRVSVKNIGDQESTEGHRGDVDASFGGMEEIFEEEGETNVEMATDTFENAGAS
ncbi:alpha/beta hydrolase [Sesbania bispinosa]|nr:alpha/beta hydrolase [Sesbania bispinosa]